MSKTIDDRVVQMEFDNSKFEGNVKTTMSTLEKLKQALNFKGVQDGAKDSASNISVLGSAVQTVGARFSSLEVIGITALTNITNKAINAGEQMLKSLTIEPVTSGFQEYELKMDSIRTIMASSKADLATVNKYLDELNKYSDETIYSFSDMTENIGKFTNAGVELPQAVLAIKGVANEAAISGANANEASRAMYNFAQALSAGYVKLIDWKSIENANMATVDFKKELLKTAEALKTVELQSDGTYKVLTTNGAGKKMDDTISATKNFNDSLAYQWMTSEVLTQTLANYADTSTEIGAKAQKAATEVATFSKAMDTLREAAGSGWAETWQTIIGDREQATELFTLMVDGISGIIQKSADARNNLAKMVMNSSWEKLSEKITDTGLDLKVFQERAAEVAKKYGIDVDRLIELDGSFGESLKRGWLNADIFRETILSLTDGLTGTTGATLSAEDALTKYSALVKDIIRGDYGNGEARVKALTEAGYDYAAVQALVNKVVYGGTLTVDDMTDSLLNMSDAELKAVGLTDEQVQALRALEVEAKYSNTSVSELIENLTKPSGRELLISTVQHSLSALSKTMDAIRKAWKNVFPTKMVSQGLYNALAAIEKFSEKLDFNYSTGKKLTTAFEGLFNILDLIRMVISGGVGLAFRVLKQVMENLGVNVLDLAASAGEAITKFHDWVVENSFIADGITIVADAITDAIKMVSEWINKIKELPQTTFIVNRVTSAIQGGYKKVGTFMSGAVKQIREFIDCVKSMDGISLKNVQTALKDFWTNVVGYFVNVGSIEDKIKSVWNYLKTFVSNIRAGGETAKEAIIGLKDTIVSKLSSIVEAIGEKLGIAGDVVSGWGDKVSGIFNTVRDFFAGIDWGSVAGIAGLAGLVAIVVKVIKWLKDLTSPLDLIEEYLDSKKIEAKAKLIESVGDVIKSIGITIAAAAAGVWILVQALKDLQTVQFDEELFNKFSTLIVGMVGLMAGTKLAGGKFQGFSILAMVIGIKLVIGLFDDIMAVDVDAVKGHLKEFGTVLGLIAALLLESRLGDWKGGVGLLAMSLGITMLLGVIKLVSMMDTGTIKKGMSALYALEPLIAVFELFSLAGKNALKAGAGVLLMSIALGLLTGIIAILGHMDETTINQGVAALWKLSAVLDAMMYFTQYSQKAKPGVLAVLVVSIIALAACVGALSLIDDNGSVERAAKSLAMVIAAFSSLEHFSNDTAKASKLAIGEMALIAAELAVLLIAMSQWSNADALLPAAQSLSLLIIAFAASLYIISKTGVSIQLTEGGQLLKITQAMVLVVAELAVILIAMSQWSNPDALLPSAQALSTLLLTFTAVTAILCVIGPGAAGAVAGLEALGLVVTAVMAFMVLVGGLNELFPDLQYFLASGIEILNQVASGIGEFVGNLIGGVGLGISDSLPAIGENIKAFCDSLSGVDDNAVTAASAIADLILSLAAADVLTGLSDIISLFTGNNEGFADKLTSFGEAFKSFSESISGIDSSDITKTKRVAEILTTMSEAAKGLPNSGGLLGAIMGNNDIDDFGDRMESLGDSIIVFADSISGLTEDSVSKATIAANIMDPIVTIANKIPNSGGWLGTIAGNNDIDDFGDRMESLGDSIVAFTSSISNIIEDDISNSSIAASIMEPMIAIAEKIPNSGGWLGTLVGNNDIDEFGKKMESLGDSIYTFCVSVKDVAPADVTHSAYVFTIMTNIINAGDLASELESDFYTIDWEAFKAGAQSMAEGLLEFTNSFSELTPGDITSAKSAITAFQEVFNIADGFKSSSIGSALSVANFKSFCNALAECGPKIVSFVNSMSGVGAESVSTSVTKLQEIINLAGSIKSSDLVNLSALTTNLSTLSSLNFSFSGIQNGSEQFEQGINSMMNAAAKSIAGSGNKMSSAMIKAVSAAAKAAQSQSSKFSTIGMTYAIRLAAGLSGGKNRVASSASTVAYFGASAASKYYNNFYSAGTNMVAGFARGIQDHIYLSVTASREMALKALNAAKKILQEHSPSKAMYQVGAYAGAGFANGLTAYTNASYNAGANVANQAINAMREAVSSVNAVLASDLDSAPTIRPVMDLSDVQSGMSAIGSIFDSPALSSYGVARSVNRMMNSRTQYANATDVVNAVRDLKGAISGVSGDTYQINGVTYDDGSNITEAVKTIVRAVTTGRRV